MSLTGRVAGYGAGTVLRANPGQKPHRRSGVPATMQGVGFTGEVATADVAAIVDAALRRLADIEPPRVRIGPARVASEGVILGVQPIEGLTRVREGLRAAIADTWPVTAVPESAGWTPHVSVAYSRVNRPDDAYQAALSGCGRP